MLPTQAGAVVVWKAVVDDPYDPSQPDGTAAANGTAPALWPPQTTFRDFAVAWHVASVP